MILCTYSLVTGAPCGRDCVDSTLLMLEIDGCSGAAWSNPRRSDSILKSIVKVTRVQMNCRDKPWEDELGFADFWR